MRALWVKGASPVCIIAGDTTVRNGYHEILENWGKRFRQSTEGSSIVTRDVRLTFQGDLGIVCCKIETLPSSGVLEKSSRPIFLDGERYSCMNVFIRGTKSDRYHLLCHVGSKEPKKGSKEVKSLQKTYQDPTRETPSSRNSKIGAGDLLQRLRLFGGSIEFIPLHLPPQNIFLLIAKIMICNVQFSVVCD